MKYLREQTRLKKKLVKRLNRLWIFKGICNLYLFLLEWIYLAYGHHQASCISIYNNGVLSEDDYGGVIRHISEFSYNQEPVYKSYKKKM